MLLLLRTLRLRAPRLGRVEVVLLLPKGLDVSAPLARGEGGSASADAVGLLSKWNVVDPSCDVSMCTSSPDCDAKTSFSDVVVLDRARVSPRVAREYS